MIASVKYAESWNIKFGHRIPIYSPSLQEKHPRINLRRPTNTHAKNKTIKNRCIKAVTTKSVHNVTSGWRSSSPFVPFSFWIGLSSRGRGWDGDVGKQIPSCARVSTSIGPSLITWEWARLGEGLVPDRERSSDELVTSLSVFSKSLILFLYEKRRGRMNGRV